MLVLKRHPGEEIVVDGPCRIVLVQASVGVARIGVEAEPGVTIHRKEVAEAIERERESRQECQP